MSAIMLRRRLRGLVLVAVLVAGLLAIGSRAGVQPTRAAWNDTGSVSTTQGAAVTMPGIGAIGCVRAGNGLSVTLSWTDVDPAYEYVVEAFNASGSRYFTTTVTASTAVIPNTTNVRAFQEFYEHTVRVTPRVAGNTSWTGTAVTRSIWEQLRYLNANPYVHCTDPS